MELRITISLDEKTTEVLEKLIGRLPGVPRIESVSDIASDGGKQPSKAISDPDDKVFGTRAKKATARKPADQDASEEEKPKKQKHLGDEVVGLEELRSLMVQVRENCGLEKTKEILRKFGAKKLSEVPEEKYDPIRKAMEEVL